ncbi:MAG: MmcQ/YjbR family DNA-binding protein, partial [Jiangellaceae bacterium]
MVTFDEVRRMTLALPETSERQGTLRVKDKPLAWLREMRAGDPNDPRTGRPYENVLGVRVLDEGVKHALIASNPDMYFTIPHFDGY